MPLKSPPPGPELVIGLVGAVGLDLGQVAEYVQRALREVSYDSQVVRLSELLHRIDWNDPLSPEGETPRDEYILRHQDKGNELRRLLGRGDALALLAVAAIRVLRADGSASDEHDRGATRHSLRAAQGELPEDEERNQDDPTPLFRRVRKPLPRFAFILRSLKHPEEAETLRDIYGERFVLIAAHAGDQRDEADLAAAIAHSRAAAVRPQDRDSAAKIAERDRVEAGNEYGQNVRDTYPLADSFVDVSDEGRLRDEVQRSVELLFGSPHETPRRDEFGMFQAYGASLRSASLGRQVGATILDRSGAVVAVGTNEVPRAGGGQYWPADSHDARDHKYEDGSDSSDIMRRAILTEILESFGDLGVPRPQATVDELLPAMRGTRIGSLVEFGRAVHAEMAAIVDGARRGVSVEGTTLYSTTFPCHTCARHILAAGITEVVYVEPYAKSLATDLHRDAIILDASSRDRRRVVFRPFVGIAPRRYAQLFSMLPRKDALGFRTHFRAGEALPRDVDLQPYYQLREWRAVSRFAEGLDSAKLRVTSDLLVKAQY